MLSLMATPDDTTILDDAFHPEYGDADHCRQYFTTALPYHEQLHGGLKWSTHMSIMPSQGAVLYRS